MSWFNKLFRKKEKEGRQAAPKRAQSYDEYVIHMRSLSQREFYDLYFNHPPIENFLTDEKNVIENMKVPEGLNTADNGTFDSFGNGGSFSGGGSSASWDDNGSSSTNSWSDPGSDSGSYNNDSSSYSGYD